MSLTIQTWTEFLEESKMFLRISECVGDNWVWHKKNDNEGNSYLVYKQKLPLNLLTSKTTNKAEDTNLALTDMLQIEYHIIYSISYQVPTLYFQAYKSDGSLLQLRDAWQLFKIYNKDSVNETTRSEMLSILTQMEHPVLFKPFLALHPCRTAELLTQAGTSRNRVLTFISLMGPYLHLNLSNEYGLEGVDIN